MANHALRYTLDQLDTAVAVVKDQMQRCSVLTFTGDLGAGKTTLIRALLRDLGVSQPITSPTFTYMNRYVTAGGKTLYHFDLYRLNSLDEFMEQGFHEYLYQPESWCLIEWPAIVMPLLTHEVCHITLDYENEARSMHWKTVEGGNYGR
jgi:tRNA threonylcarbamoyladenosine biosynthesis protein TsaE